MAQTGKVYLAKPHTSANIGGTGRVELRGTVNLVIYGTENDIDTITNSSDMTPATETLTADSYYAMDTLPKYIAFVGTANVINVAGYDLEYQKDLA